MANKQNIIGKIAVLGSSNGAVSAIMAAAIDKRIEAVIADNPFSSRIKQLRFAFKTVLRKGQWGNEKLTEISLIGKILNHMRSYIPDWYIELAVVVTNIRMGGHTVLEAIDVVQDIAPRGLLLMHGEDDVVVPVENSRELFNKVAHQSVFLWIAQGGHHARLLNQFTDEYIDRTVNFLNKWIGLCA